MTKWLRPVVWLALINASAAFLLHLGLLANWISPASHAAGSILALTRHTLLALIFVVILAVLLTRRRWREQQSFARYHPGLTFLQVAALAYGAFWLGVPAGDEQRFLQAGSAGVAVWSFLSFSSMYPLVQLSRKYARRLCMNGHEVPGWSDRCEVCGSQFIEARDA